MFAIIEGKLFIAPKNSSESHLEWLQRIGWICNKDDIKFEKIIRGIIEKDGSLCFYKGNNFEISKKTETEFFKNLKQLAKELNLKKETRIFGGKIKGEVGKQWKNIKSYGLLGDWIFSQ